VAVFTRKIVILGFAVALAMPVVAGAQRGGRGGFGGGPGGGDVAALQEIRTQIHASDEEWKVIGPKIRELISARQAVEARIDPGAQTGGNPQGGGFGGPGGRGGGRGGNDPFDGPAQDSGGGRFGRGGRGGRGGGPGGDFGGGRFGRGGDFNDEPGGFGPPPDQQDFVPSEQRGFGQQNQGAPQQQNSDQPAPQNRAPRANAPQDQDGFVPQLGGFGPPPGGFGGDPNSPNGPQQFGRGGDFNGGGRGGRGGGPGGFGGQGGNAVLSALTDLRTALNDEKTTPEELRVKLAAARAAREKARQQFTALQKELMELLDEQQQATLVNLGYLD
jgi:hypothetical protein